MVADKEQHPEDTAGLRQRHEAEEESVSREYSEKYSVFNAYLTHS